MEHCSFHSLQRGNQRLAGFFASPLRFHRRTTSMLVGLVGTKDLERQTGGAKSVVDVHNCYSGTAAGEHGVERDHSARVVAASRATGMSAVPAVMTGTSGISLFARGLRTAMRASG